MYRLICNAQNYDWGRKGLQSKVALFKQAQDSEFDINENESYAELWMG
jgi:mannose-6-phosphate isomerase